jgi:undecaprenyl-diphosphatase
MMKKHEQRGVALLFALGMLTILLITGMAFLITAMLLRMTDKKKLIPDSEQAVSVKEISWRQALIVGFVQLGALLPGISRSGSTIAAGIFCGIKREDAAAFSFLLALPAIGGATLLETISMMSQTTSEQVSALQIAVSVVFSFAASLGALTGVVNIVKKSKLSLFSWYLFALGIAVIIWQLYLLHGAK